jgi:hypothetical protein
MLAGNQWNGAIGTMAVAALTNLDIGIMARRSDMAPTLAGLERTALQIL